MFMITLWWCQAATAQTGFVHIQSENGQPFYVQWNGYTYSSSGTGYMIIPRMPAGEQSMIIGFARNQFPEYLFKYTLGEKPRGFSLKLNIDNSWSLFDMVNFTIIRGKAISTAEKDTLVKEAERMARANRPRDPQENVFKTVEVKDSAKTIYKIFDKTTDEGMDLVYVVNNDGKMDTVVIFIPTEPAKPEVNRGAPIPLQGLPKPVSRYNELLVATSPGRRNSVYSSN